MKIVTIVLPLLFLMLVPQESYAQENSEDEAEAEYLKRIKKSRIGGTYIPKDFEDAFIELGRLSEKADLNKFKNAPEVEVAKKLHFGLGKWMMRNWSFYEGSRYSHFLRKQGIHHPDDMAQLTIRLFHRHLNEADLSVQPLLKEISDARSQEYKRSLEGQEVIDSFRRKRE